METFMLYELASTKTTKALTRNPLNWVGDLYTLHLSGDVVLTACRLINGYEVCDALDLDTPSLRGYCLFLGLQFIVIALTYTARSIPVWNKIMIRVSDSYAWSLVVVVADLPKSSGAPISLMLFRRMPILREVRCRLSLSTSHSSMRRKWR